MTNQQEKRSATLRNRRLRRNLLRWWDAGHREMPWRQTATSYEIWVAEVMSQQTRLAVVSPAWARFVAAFPDVRALAAADEEEVLAQWSGLGYYTRARSLHRAARELNTLGQKEFPRDWKTARALPGVGDYTAAAVLSIAHGRAHAAVDGNVIRVLSRIDRFGRPDAKNEPYVTRATELLAKSRPGDWNQALMELGETLCRAKNPLCEPCPLRSDCRARRDNVIEDHPPKKARPAAVKVGIEITLARDGSGDLLLERGVFPYLPHLWLPPIRELPAPIPRGDFRHAILHRNFEVIVRTRKLGSRRLKREVGAGRGGTERKLVRPDEIASLGRSSLLTKALRHELRTHPSPR